jgi:hypothetical protein
VQELLPGSPPKGVDVRLVEEMLAVNRRLYGVLAGTCGTRSVKRHTRHANGCAVLPCAHPVTRLILIGQTSAVVDKCFGDYPPRSSLLSAARGT